MKAIISKDHHLLEREVEVPTFSSTQCLVKIHYTGINRADLLQVKGLYPPPKGESEILGLEFSGEIVEKGKDVQNFQVGDGVCTIVASGAYAEYVAVESDHLLATPSNVSMQEAAAIPEAFITSYQSLIHIAHLKAKERILIHAGASGVGSAAIQMAKSLGAFVICTASLGKHDYCFELGANRCINYKREEFDEVVQNVDVVLDLIGGSYFQKNLDVLAPDGRMVMLGFLGGVKAPSTNVAGIVTKRISIQGSTLRARSKAYKSMLITSFINKFVASGHFPFRTNVDKVFDFSEVGKAHQYMAENRNKGKILLKI